MEFPSKFDIGFVCFLPMGPHTHVMMVGVVSMNFFKIFRVIIVVIVVSHIKSTSCFTKLNSSLIKKMEKKIFTENIFVFLFQKTFFVVH